MIFIRFCIHFIVVLVFILFKEITCIFDETYHYFEYQRKVRQTLINFVFIMDVV